MADQSDVETALVSLIAAALYPQGPDQPSPIGPLCRIYRGWPIASALDADLASGAVHVTVFPSTDARITTRYPIDFATAPTTPTPLQAAISGVSVTFSGSADAGQIAGIAVGPRTYVYATVAGDSPSLVAANLAVLARADQIVDLSGATLTIPGASRLTARVVARVAAVSELRRQVQSFRVTCWCPSPAIRDQVASAIDLALAQSLFIALPDGTGGRLLSAGGATIDRAEDAALYRRDLVCSVEYPTTITQIQPAMLYGAGIVNAIDFIA